MDTNLPTLRFKIVTLTRLLYNLIDNALKYGNGNVFIISTMDGEVPMVSVLNPIFEWDFDNEAETLVPASPFEGHLTSGSNKLLLETVKRITEMHNIALDITQDADAKTIK